MDQSVFDFADYSWDNFEDADSPLSSISWGSSAGQPGFPSTQLGIMESVAPVSQELAENVFFPGATHVDTSSVATEPSPYSLDSQDWPALGTDGIYYYPNPVVTVPNIPDSASWNSFNFQDCTESPYTTPSPAGTKASVPSQVTDKKPCPHCNHKAGSKKDLRRHVVEVHEKPLWGEKKSGWYLCRCQKQIFRKDNYKRHLDKCKPSKWSLSSFLCYCGKGHKDKDGHVAHIEHCRVGKRPVGRPPSSGVQGGQSQYL